MSSSPNIIVFEGGEGVGKTTQIKLLQYLLEDTGFFAFFREPGGTKEAEQIREVFIRNDLELSPVSELLLMTASRHENIIKNILPALEANKFVVLDRFVLSTLIYQGKIHNIDIAKIKDLHNWFNHGITPKLTIILNPKEPSIISQRLNNIDRKNNKIDEKGVDFHQEIYDLYTKAHEFYEGEIEYIDANQDVEKIHNQITTILKNKNVIRSDIKPLNTQEIVKILT